MNLNIAVLPGDGIGPEITNQSVKVLKAVAQKYNHDFKFDFGTKAGAKTPDYTYNWPYDFFSLVELAKLDTSITIKVREGDA